MNVQHYYLEVIIISSFFLLCVNSHSQNRVLHTKEFEAQDISHEDLKYWQAYGLGDLVEDHGQTVIRETEGSVGYMLVNPQVYYGDVTVEYNVMTLNPANVLILELAAHNRDDYGLTFTENYNGDVGYLFNHVFMYMFAFHNAAHNKTGPFVRKFPKPGHTPLAAASKNLLKTGKYHHVQMGIVDNRLFFNVDDKNI